MRKAGLPFPLVVITLSTLVLGSFGRINSRDLWWHIRGGEEVFQQGFIRENRFSFSSSGHEWIYHGWLSGLLFYLVHRTFGLTGLILMRGLLFVFLIAAVFLRLYRWRGETFALLIFPLSLFLLYPQATLRPWILSNPLLLVMVLLLNSGRELRGVGLVSTLIVPLILAQVHGTFTIALFYTALHALFLPRGMVRLILLLAIPLTLLNPYGVALHSISLSYLLGLPFQGYITEWQSPGIDLHSGIFLLFLLLAGRALVEEWKGGGPFRKRDAVAFVVFAVLAVKDFRNSTPFFILLFPALRHLKMPSLIQGASKRWEGRVRPISPLPIILASMGSIALIIGGITLLHGKDPLKGYFVRGEDCPEDAARFLLSLPGEKRVFNHFYTGGYLIFRGFPEIRVFYDQRNDPYDEGVVRDYFRFHHRREGWEGIPSRWRANYILWKRDEGVVDTLAGSGEWLEIYSDRHFTVLTKRERP